MSAKKGKKAAPGVVGRKNARTPRTCAVAKRFGNEIAVRFPAEPMSAVYWGKVITATSAWAAQYDAKIGERLFLVNLKKGADE